MKSLTCLSLAIIVPIWAANAQDVVKVVRQRRPVTVPDTVRMTKLGDWRYYWGASSAGRVAQFSPDGSKFVVVLRKGNLEQNTNEFSLLLWNTDEVFGSPAAKVLLTMSTSSNRDAIEGATWLDDGQTLAFMGESPDQLHQVYTFNIKTRTLKRITNHPTNVRSFSITPDGNRVAYTAEEPAKSIWDERAKKEGIIVSNQRLPDLVAGRKNGETLDGQLFFQSNANSRPMKTLGKLPRWYDTPFLSPDGKYVVVGTYVSEVPEIWKEYSDKYLKLQMRQAGVERYILLKTETGESRVLLDSPIGPYVSEGAWSPDSLSVVVSCVYLPLTNSFGDEREARKSKTFAVEVGVPSGRITKISDEDLKVSRWNAQTNQLIFEARQKDQNPTPASKVFFRKSGDKWEKVANSKLETPRPEVILEEDMNTAPKIFAVDSTSCRKTMLWDLNPQFKDLEFGRVEAVTWKGSDGHEVKGGIYYPVNYAPGKRYPLVIQTHGWNPDKFWIDGEMTTAFAAQPLAGKDIMVLQADEIWYGPDFNTPKEVDREVATIEGATDYLDKRGLIDRNRVGLIGFSRTCLFVKYALTHSTYRFAAASVTDGVDGGYFAYMAFLNGNLAWSKLFHEGINGGLPFGKGLQSWMERSPGFNMDRVQTPLRITALNSMSALGEWEWFAGLTSLSKPVEMVMLPDGQHALEKPWERMVSQQGNVDWFCFWLKGEEDPDPTKAEQFARWRELRKLQEKNEATRTGSKQ